MDCGLNFADSLLRHLNIDALPAVKVFRNGSPSAYLGPLADPSVVLVYVYKDSLPSVKTVSTMSALQEYINADNSITPLVAVFFSDDDLPQLKHFNVAADKLRGLDLDGLLQSSYID